MTEREMRERAHQRLAELGKLPPAEYFRLLVEWGVIDEKGEVLWGNEADGKQGEVERNGKS